MAEFMKEKFFSITSICKEDMREVFKEEPETLAKIEGLTDATMKWIASKMSDDYCNQLYWDSLRNITKNAISNLSKKQKVIK